MRATQLIHPRTLTTHTTHHTPHATHSTHIIQQVLAAFPRRTEHRDVLARKSGLDVTERVIGRGFEIYRHHLRLDRVLALCSDVNSSVCR